MKKYLILLLLPLSFAFVSCSDDDEVFTPFEEDYNADEAVSVYEATDYRKVKSIEMTAEKDGRGYSWKYNFSYDAQNRIKSIDTECVTHWYYSTNKRWYRINRSTKAEYYYKEGNQLKIAYSVTEEYPAYPDWNNTVEEWYVGRFNDNGFLESFASFDCVYNGATLTNIHVDGGRQYQIVRAQDCVSGYIFIPSEGENAEVADYSYIHKYTRIINQTNIDFSGLFGNWVLEREIPGCEEWPYAPFQLAAFDMLGTRSLYLPIGDWQFDIYNSPVAVTLPQGYKCKIAYVD